MGKGDDRGVGGRRWERREGSWKNEKRAFRREQGGHACLEVERSGHSDVIRLRHECSSVRALRHLKATAVAVEEQDDATRARPVVTRRCAGHPLRSALLRATSHHHLTSWLSDRVWHVSDGILFAVTEEATNHADPLSRLLDRGLLEGVAAAREANLLGELAD